MIKLHHLAPIAAILLALPASAQAPTTTPTGPQDPAGPATPLPAPLFDTNSAHAPTPSWISLDHFGSLDVRFMDFDSDGDLDVISMFPVSNSAIQNPVPPSTAHGVTPDPWPGGRWLRFWENKLTGGVLTFEEIYDRVDVTNANSAPNRAFPFEKSSHLDLSNRTYLSGPYVINLVDVNDDGFEDMVIGNQLGYDCVYYWDDQNDRFGTYERLLSSETSGTLYTDATNPWDVTPQNRSCDSTTAGYHLAPSRLTVTMEVADLNGDGLPDLVAGYRDHGPVVLLNNYGNWLQVANPTPFEQTEVLPIFPDELNEWAYPNVGNRSIQLGDLDGDGDLDAVVARSSSITFECMQAKLSTAEHRLDAVRVYENTSKKHSEGTSGPFFEAGYKLAPGVAPEANRSSGHPGYLNLEPGNEGAAPYTGSPTLQITLADLNGDGDLDLIVPVQHAPRNWFDPEDEVGCSAAAGQLYDRVLRDYRTRVYLGDGTGWLGERLTLPANYVVSCNAGTDWNLTARSVPSQWIGAFDARDRGDNLKSAFAGVADLDNNGTPDVALAHNAEVNSASGPNPPASQDEIYEEMDKLWLTKVMPNQTAPTFYRPSFPGVTNPDAFPPPSGAWHVPGNLPLPLANTWTNWTNLGHTKGEEFNDNTRYIRFADLDNDGDLDWVECQFFNLSYEVGVNPPEVFAHHIRIFLNQLQ